MSSLLEMRGISKSFSSVAALQDVNLDLRRGEVHSLLGENGAGKSTLIKILGGIYTKDEGEIYINGKLTNISDVQDAENNGISIIHQELMLHPEMAIYENVFLGKEEKTSGLLNRNKMINQTKDMLEFFSLDVDPAEKLGNLSIAQQQLVEIVRAISFGANIIVMDEPTSSLTDKEVEFLFSAIGRLQQENVGIIYISHRMSEHYRISDRISVLRDGRIISTHDINNVTRETLITEMVGRSLGDFYVHTHLPSDEIAMRVTDYSDGDKVKTSSFNLKKGEVLGFAGLVGAGRSELMSILFGITKKVTGELEINGEKVNIENVRDAINCGMAFVPEDRKMQALFLDQTVRYNLTITVLDEFIKSGSYNSKKEDQIVSKYTDMMSVKMASPEQIILRLSGGNQQKVIIGRWLASQPKILILDEPTRGVDIGAKVEIYKIIDQLAKEGVSIILVSSELPEILGMCDRVVVMGDGKIKGYLDKSEASQEKIMEIATSEI